MLNVSNADIAMKSSRLRFVKIFVIKNFLPRIFKNNQTGFAAAKWNQIQKDFWKKSLELNIGC